MFPKHPGGGGGNFQKVEEKTWGRAEKTIIKTNWGGFLSKKKGYPGDRGIGRVPYLKGEP